jgi:hypothetical protein
VPLTATVHDAAAGSFTLWSAGAVVKLGATEGGLAGGAGSVPEEPPPQAAKTSVTLDIQTQKMRRTITAGMANILGSESCLCMRAPLEPRRGLAIESPASAHGRVPVAAVPHGRMTPVVHELRRHPKYLLLSWLERLGNAWVSGRLRGPMRRLEPKFRASARRS